MALAGIRNDVWSGDVGIMPGVYWVVCDSLKGWGRWFMVLENEKKGWGYFGQNLILLCAMGFPA